MLLLVIGAPKERRVTRVCACGGRRTYIMRSLSSPVSIWGPASVCERVSAGHRRTVSVSLFGASVIKKQQKIF